MKYLKFKEELKKEALKIRQKKEQRKTESFGYVYGLDSMRHNFRHKHIAYCLLRGRTMSQIEKTVREGNEPSEALIEHYKSLYQEEKTHEEEAVCACG